MANTAYKENHTLKSALKNLIEKLNPAKSKAEEEAKIKAKSESKSIDLPARKLKNDINIKQV